MPSLQAATLVSFKDGVQSVNLKSHYKLSWVLHKFYLPALLYLILRRKGKKRPGQGA